MAETTREIDKHAAGGNKPGQRQAGPVGLPGEGRRRGQRRGEAGKAAKRAPSSTAFSEAMPAFEAGRAGRSGGTFDRPDGAQA